MNIKAVLFDENALNRSIVRIAHQLIEKNENVSEICLVGIKTRGVPLASRIASAIFDIEGVKVPTGEIDITLYRDDLSYAQEDMPNVKGSSIEFNIQGSVVVLVDDVIYTGRTVRAALDALVQFGRPSRIQLAVLVDRGHRELPIRADYVGKNIPTSKNEVVCVKLKETDGVDSVEICER